MDRNEVRSLIAELDWKILAFQGRIRNLNATKREDKYSRFYREAYAEEAAAGHMLSLEEPLSREELQAQLRQLESRKLELRQALGQASADVSKMSGDPGGPVKHG